LVRVVDVGGHEEVERRAVEQLGKERPGRSVRDLQRDVAADFAPPRGDIVESKAQIGRRRDLDDADRRRDRRRPRLTRRRLLPRPGPPSPRTCAFCSDPFQLSNYPITRLPNSI
jgi:hypothetical protein